MPTYTLKAVTAGDRYTTKHGQFEAWDVEVEHDGGAVVAQLSTKADSKAPEVGETVDATLTSSSKGWRLKKNFKPSGGSGGGSGGKKGGYEEWPPAHERDPYKDACIITTSAIKAAINLLAVEVAAGMNFQETKATDFLRPRVDYFFKMIRDAGEAAENHAKTKPDLS